MNYMQNWSDIDVSEINGMIYIQVEDTAIEIDIDYLDKLIESLEKLRK
jgi:hypothetical protein